MPKSNMAKIVWLGQSQLSNGRRANVYAKIKLSDGVLSISGVEGPKANGDCLGGCGQIDMHLQAKDITPTSNWTVPMLEQFFAVWSRWHLNDMRAECEHQRKRGESWSTHPSAVCPDCGYKLGHAWLREELPGEVIDFLSGLPETDMQPAADLILDQPVQWHPRKGYSNSFWIQWELDVRPYLGRDR